MRNKAGQLRLFEIVRANRLYPRTCKMRVPAQVAIPIVALCATTGLVLGWLFPLSPSHDREVAHTHTGIASLTDTGKVRESMDRLTPEDRREDEHVTEPPPLPTPARKDPANSDSPALSANDENVRTSNEPVAITRNEEHRPTPLASEEAALSSVAHPDIPDAKPQNKTNAQHAKSVRETARRSTKIAQKPASHRTRQEQGRDDPPAREKQTTGSIVSQFPIVGPVFGLLIP
jgi:hypothetical protein